MSRRERFAKAGTAVAFVTFVTALLGYAVLEASFKTWTVGRYVAGRANVFVNGFTLMFLIACLTLGISALGDGRYRTIGVVFSMTTLALIAFVFWSNI